MKKIGFIGFGLIGGSLAKIWHKNHTDYVMIAYSRKRAPSAELLQAKEDGVIADIAFSLSNFSDCNIIFLCAPVLANIEYLGLLKDIINKECVITDVGSVKGLVSKYAEENGLLKNFIGGHPMAGSEKTGYTNAVPTLFENAYYILTPFKETPKENVERLTELIKETKAVPVILPADKHDSATAAISHVPHIIASALVNSVAAEDEKDGTMAMLAAGGFRDVTRIAASSPEMWRDICLSNRNSILSFLDIYIDKLAEIKDLVSSENKEALFEFFENSKEYRSSLPLRRSNMNLSHEILLYIPDEPGSIAILATILASKEVSIKNIGIAHNREYSEGVLRIEFYDNASLEKAKEALRERNYNIFEK